MATPSSASSGYRERLLPGWWVWLVAGGLDPAQVTVISPGLRTAEFSAPPIAPARIPGLEPGRPVAMSVGSTHAYQGLDLLASAQRRLGRTVTFVLVLSRDAGAPSSMSRRPS